MKKIVHFIKIIAFIIFLTPTLNGCTDWIKSGSTSQQKEEAVPSFIVTQENKTTFQNQVQGCILGGAIGDALGRITEQYWMFGLGHNKRIINNFNDFKKEDYIKGVAFYTDDTQMAKIILETLLENNIRSKEIPKDWHPVFKTYKKDLERINKETPKDPTWKAIFQTYQPKDNDLGQLQKVMGDIAIKFVDWVDDPDGGKSPYRAPGIGCIDASKVLKKLTKHPETKKLLKTSSDVLLAWAPDRQIRRTGWWTRHELGKVKPLTEGGCGSVMRSYPFGLMFIDNPEKAASWAAAHSLITHRAPLAIAACAAMAGGIAYAAQGKSPDIVMQKMIEFAKQYDSKTANMMEKATKKAKKKPSDEKIKKYLTSLEGKLGNQAIAATIYLFACHPDDLLKVIQLGVNFYGDTDSVASMAGSLVGVRVGAKVLFDQQNYNKWLEPLEDREKLINLGKQVVAQYLNTQI